MSNAPNQAAAADAFYAAFLENLRTDLVLNSKPVIHSLTQIAGENKPFARAIVNALRNHILEVCEASSSDVTLLQAGCAVSRHSPPTSSATLSSRSNFLFGRLSLHYV